MGRGGARRALGPHQTDLRGILIGDTDLHRAIQRDPLRMIHPNLHVSIRFFLFSPNSDEKYRRLCFIVL